MRQKTQLRKKYFNLRKKKYFDIEKNFFLPLLKLIRSKLKKRLIKIALYYPSNYELNVLKFNDLAGGDQPAITGPWKIKGLSDKTRKTKIIK